MKNQGYTYPTTKQPKGQPLAELGMSGVDDLITI